MFVVRKVQIVFCIVYFCIASALSLKWHLIMLSKTRKWKMEWFRKRDICFICWFEIFRWRKSVEMTNPLLFMTIIVKFVHTLNDLTLYCLSLLFMKARKKKMGKEFWLQKSINCGSLIILESRRANSKTKLSTLVSRVVRLESYWYENETAG